MIIHNLTLIFALGVHGGLGKHLGQEIFEQAKGELEAGPICDAVLKYPAPHLQRVTCVS